MAEYTTIITNWKHLENGLPYKWIVDYASYNAYGNFKLSAEDWEKRDYIVNFKGNSELTTEIDHQQALKKAISDITTLIKETFGNAANQLTLVCIPASTRANTKRRLRNSARRSARRLVWLMPIRLSPGLPVQTLTMERKRTNTPLTSKPSRARTSCSSTTLSHQVAPFANSQTNSKKKELT